MFTLPARQESRQGGSRACRNPDPDNDVRLRMTLTRDMRHRNIAAVPAFGQAEYVGAGLPQMQRYSDILIDRVRTTGLAGGLLSPYKGLLPACARKAH